MNILYVQDPSAFNGNRIAALRRAVQNAIYGRQDSVIIDGVYVWAVEFNPNYAIETGYFSNITMRLVNGEGENRANHPSLIAYQADLNSAVRSDIVEDCVNAFSRQFNY